MTHGQKLSHGAVSLFDAKTGCRQLMRTAIPRCAGFSSRLCFVMFLNGDRACGPRVRCDCDDRSDCRMHPSCCWFYAYPDITPWTPPIYTLLMSDCHDLAMLVLLCSRRCMRLRRKGHIVQLRSSTRSHDPRCYLYLELDHDTPWSA